MALLRGKILLYWEPVFVTGGICLPYIEDNDHLIHYVEVDRREDRAVGLPLLLVHGAGSSHLSWALTIREMCSRNRVIAIDLSGHGRSNLPRETLSIDKVFVDDVVTVVQHLDLRDFILAGHSMGGAVAMCHTLRKNPQKPRGLVLVDTAPTLDLSRLLPSLVKEVMDERVHPLSLEDFPDAATIRRYEERVIILHPSVIHRDLAACSGFSISHRFREIDTPAFVMVGEKDDIITPRMAVELKDALPRADLAVVKGAHHVPMLEAPDVFNQPLGKFVDWLQRKSP